MAFVCEKDGKTFSTKRELNKYMFDTFYTFADKQQSEWIKNPGDVTNMPIKLARLKGCKVMIIDQTEQVVIEDCQGCEIFIAASVSSVFVRNTTQCQITCGCRQLFLDKSSHCVCNLYSILGPRLTGSFACSFQPFGAKFPRAFEIWSRAKLFPTERKLMFSWAKVDDFDADLDTEELPQPHFRCARVLNAEEFPVEGEGVVNNPMMDRMPEGLEVSARFEKGEDWFRGTITKVKAGGAYDIQYEDGDFEENVAAGMVCAWFEPDAVEAGAEGSAPVGASQVWESAVLPFPMAKVWGLVSGLDLSKVLPSEVASCELESGSGWKTVGAVRTTTYRDGAVWTTRLVALSELTNSMTWEVIAAEPCVGFVSRVDTLALKRVTCDKNGGATLVEWQSNFSSDAGVDVTQDCRMKKLAAFKEMRGVLAAPALPAASS